MRSIFLSAFIFVSTLTWAQDKECNYSEELIKASELNMLEKNKICKSLPKIEKESDLKDVLKFYYSQAKKKDHPNRHQANKNLNRCLPDENSKALVIAFEGTGAYEPLIPAMMSRFNKCFGGKVSKKLNNKVYHLSREIYKADKGRDSKWSGLQAGVMSEMIGHRNSKDVDWYSFPSEEVEQLAGLEELKDISIKELYENIKDSVDSNPKGIKNARDCIMQYLSKAKLMGITPKIILTSHSSGGRSLVKFAEHMKKDVGVDVDLAFSIDPVKEAHHAVEEVVPQKLGEPIRYLKWQMDGKKKTYPYSAVWSRRQEKKLYKSGNIKKYQNFYQKNDREGLKVGGNAMRFGIHGSPVEGAQNKYIKGLGTSGHGEITYNSTVLMEFNSSFQKLFE